MKTGKPIYYIDALVILLSFAGVRGNALLFKLLGVESQRLVTDLVLLTDVVYICFNSKRIFNYTKSPYLRPAFFFIAIPALNVFNNYVIENAGLGVQFDWLLLFSIVIVILRGLAKDYYKNDKEKSIKWMARGYIWISLISILGVYIAFALTLALGPDYTPFDADFLAKHNEREDVSHYWCYTSMLMQELFSIRIPFFQEYGYLTGLYHEPHIFAMNAFPALLLLFGIAKSKWQDALIVITIILSFLFSGSLTSLISLTICLVIYFFLNSKHKILPTLLTIALIAIGVYIFLQVTGSVYADFVAERLDNSESGSRGYSENALVFAFTPHSLLGKNIMSTEAARDMIQYGTMGGADVGFVAFLLNILFIITYSLNMSRLILTEHKTAKAVGFASLYCLLHSAKSGMGMYLQLTPILLVFLQYLAIEAYGRRKAITKDTQNRIATAVE